MTAVGGGDGAPAGPGTSAGPAARLTGITKTFDDFVALDHVDLDLARGEVHALLGENGAGKTTLSNILAGIYRATTGAVEIEGVPVNIRSPGEAIACGVGMVHQHFKLVSPMTVAENISLGWKATPSLLSRRVLESRTRAISDEFGIPVEPAAAVWQLSVGEQQRVEILRTLARGAQIIILDEPTAVLTDAEAGDLFATLRRLVATGRTVVFISHKLREVMAVSDRVTVLRGGRKVSTHAVADTTVRQLAALMTGEERQLEVRRGPSVVGGKVVELTGVTARNSRGLVAVRHVDLAVHEGEIVGLAGVSGNGQTELAELIGGLREPESGTIVVDGIDVAGRSTGSVTAAGVGHIPEDRIGTALVKGASVRRNAILRHYRTPQLSRRHTLRGPATREFADKLIEDASVQVRNPRAPISQLSGGNQQRLVARREVWVASRLLLAAHPTRGLDIHASHDIQEALLERRRAGCGVLLISDDLDEILQLSDRIVVMYAGAVVGQFAAADADRQRIGLLMGGHRDEGAVEADPPAPAGAP